MKKTVLPVVGEDKDRSQLFKFLLDNKSLLVAEKKYFGKEGEAISFQCPLFDNISKTFKADVSSTDLLSKDEITVKIAINSTNLLDSHSDVHIPGIWKRNLKNSANSVLHLQEHKNGFLTIIADGYCDEVKAYTETMTWKELGYDFKGSTEVLLFDSIVKKTRNAFMFEQYAKKFVKNHSVGMQYVKMILCINSEEKYYRKEKEMWDEYYPQVANQETADENGYFWAVTEAKVIEGSAVPRGSNFATPTIDMKSDSGNHSETDPSQDTQIKTLNYLIENFKLN